jgi:hypothetical protein
MYNYSIERGGPIPPFFARGIAGGNDNRSSIIAAGDRSPIGLLQ